MSLHLTQKESEETPRFDAATLRKVVQLAERLQAREADTVSQADLEKIGAEVGLRPESIRAAVRELKSQDAPKPARKRNATDKAIVAGFWSGGWILGFLGMGAAHLVGMGSMEGIAFCTGIGAYVGIGVLLSGIIGQSEQDENMLAAAQQFQRSMVLNQFARLQEAQPAAATRHVAFLRVKSSGGDHAQLDTESEELRRLQSWVERIIRSAGGQPHGTLSEGLLASFTEDAAAVRAARTLQDGVADFNYHHRTGGVPFALRCGVRAGEVPATTDAWDLAGHPVARSAREYQHAASPGDVVVGPELAAVALTELGPIAPLPEDISGEAAFSWLAARR